MKLISKSELLEWFRPYGHMDEPITFENLAGFVRDIATTYAPTSGWISVEDRLPEASDANKNGLVLILRKGGTIRDATYNGVAFNSRNSNPLMIVTHWMPLPEPPKEAEREAK